MEWYWHGGGETVAAAVDSLAGVGLSLLALGMVILFACRPDDPDLKDAGVWALKIKGTATLIERDGGPELDPRLDVRGGDSLLVKKYASCFFGTDLVPRLVTAGVDTLILAGCTTSGCVRASAVDAIQNGFRPGVVPEAVGDRSGSAHTQSLSDLAMKYADVVPLADVVEYLSKEK